MGQGESVENQVTTLTGYGLSMDIEQVEKLINARVKHCGMKQEDADRHILVYRMKSDGNSNAKIGAVINRSGQRVADILKKIELIKKSASEPKHDLSIRAQNCILSAIPAPVVAEGEWPYGKREMPEPAEVRRMIDSGEFGLRNSNTGKAVMREVEAWLSRHGV